MDEPVISVKNLYFSYNSVPVLENVTFDVADREFLAIIGPNGGGKSTLIKLMLGLLKPDAGQVRVFNKPPAKVSYCFGYVPQDVLVNKGFPISVFEVVLMGRLRHHRRARIGGSDREAAARALEIMGMRKYENHKIDDLSGGQRERVFIARALTIDPDILVLDEPTASVDTGGRAELYNLLKDLNRTRTIVVVSHDLMVMYSNATAVACVNRQLYYHDKGEITQDMLDLGYQCPVELIAHGQPHRVLKVHEDGS
ncbi:MAG: metal ABC transporter ATP-binding protein [Desulfobacterales bacterium]|nr:metal ABC transporter ATP-binding protein [Desulfobacterales bacterium]